MRFSLYALVLGEGFHVLFNVSHAQVTEIELVIESKRDMPIGISAAKVTGDEESHDGLLEIGEVLECPGDFFLGVHPYAPFLFLYNLSGRGIFRRASSFF